MSKGSAWLQLVFSCAIVVGLGIFNLVEPFWKSPGSSVLGGVVFTSALAFCLGSCAKLAAAFVLTHARNDASGIGKKTTTDDKGGPEHSQDAGV